MLMEDVRMKEGLQSCMNCGVCTGVCPAAEFYNYDPRQIVNIVQTRDDDAIEELLKSDTIWYCGECVDYPERRHCCGFGFRNYLVQANRGYSIANSHKKLESMAPYKPDFIVANCPGCAMFLDKWQYTIAEMEGTTYGQNGHGIPVLTYEEMAGLVLGYDPWALGMQMHQVDVEPLLDKMGVEYDPAAKYLGRNGKYIGKPASAVVNCCPTDTIYDIRE